MEQKVQKGDTIDYVKTVSGYKIKAIAKLNRIDKKYYFNQLQKLTNIFTKNQIFIGNDGASMQTFINKF